MEFTHHNWNEYHITGIDRSGKRFKRITTNPYHALGINVWRGSLYQVNRKSGKRRLLRRVYN